MSAKTTATISAPTKETGRQGSEAKGASASLALTPCLKPSVPAIKIAVNKAVTIVQPKEMATVPQEEDPELLGSLTTEQQQRTSARVIKKLRLEPQPQKRSDADEVPDCETPSKIDEKELKFPTVKQRMPKALWSTDEKNLFFEALNEYGKDFDAITSYICAKMKKKGMPDSNLKTKTQVSHFYYRTWHKLSKHVHFDENVKKVAQELYALINYGELRKKLVSVNEKTCGRLGELVLGGSMVVRARGRNLRVRTPMCRALRRLNQITERVCGSRVCARASVSLRARDAHAWARVQAAAHNPRVQLLLAPRTRLRQLLHALQRRWKTAPSYKHKFSDDREEEADKHCDDNELENHLNLELDRVIVEEQKAPKKLALHVGPPPHAALQLPAASPAEPLSNHKICFASYRERMAGIDNAKIRTPKRQRKDSATEKDKEVEQKKFKSEEVEPKSFNIEETAIDGIELMASYKNLIEYEDEIKEDTAEEEAERDKDMSEKEKDSFSEMEDDERYNKSDTDNESDGKSGKERKFKNLKVKFRIRPKKRGGSVYTLVTDDAKEECKEDKPDIDVDMALKQIRRGWSVKDAGDLTVGDLYLMFGNRSKIELDYWWAEPTSPLPRPLKQIPELDKDGARERKPSDKDSSVEDEKGVKENEDLMSPKMNTDSNDGMSADERKNDQLLSPEHKSPTSTLKLVSKLINRPSAPPPAQNGFAQLSERLKRLLALAGNPHLCSMPRAPPRRRPGPPGPPGPPAPPPAAPALPSDSLFRHPPPIAPKAEKSKPTSLDMVELPRGRRGRPRGAARRIVVQRLLPLLPKLPPPSTLIPVKLVPDSPPALPKILPKPPPTSTSDLSFFYVLSESNGQFYFHDGDRRIPITQLPDQERDDDDDDDLVPKSEVLDVDDDDDEETATLTDSNLNPGAEAARLAKENQGSKKEPDIGSFLASESMSLSPSRLLRDSEWLDGSVQDFSLSSFLGHLEARAPPDLAVDSHLQSLMAESSVDYVAKFADLAAEVTGEPYPRAAD